MPQADNPAPKRIDRPDLVDKVDTMLDREGTPGMFPIEVIYQDAEGNMLVEGMMTREEMRKILKVLDEAVPPVAA